jgi:hypothetical protein
LEEERGILFLAYDIERLLFKFNIISFWLKETRGVDVIK